MPKVNVLKPSFYDKFQCIGGDCRTNCCQNWNILISKEEFKRMKNNIQSEALKEIFENAFEGANHKSMSQINEYKMKLDAGKCKFLDENGLCMIYKECGPENMPWVCQIFPRKKLWYGNERVEYSLSLGCEEVVRLLLEEKEGFLLESIEEEINKDTEHDNTVSTLLIKVRPILKYMYDVKTLVFAVLQNRRYKMEERIVLLGFALRNIDKMEKEKREEEVPQYVASFLEGMDLVQNEKMYREFFTKAKGDGTLKFNNMLLNLDVYNYITTQGLLLKSRMTKRFQIQQTATPFIKNEENYERRYMYTYDKDKFLQAEKDFQKWQENYPHALENIIVALAWQMEFPFGLKKDIWQNYCLFAEVYTFYYTILISYLEKDSPKEDFIDIVSFLSRTLPHGEKRIKNLAEELEKNENATLAHMAMLVL